MPGLLRTVAAVPTPEEAHAVRLRLEAEGIEAVLADETTVGFNWLLGGALGQVKVQVVERDYARAMHLLVGDEDDGEADDAASAEWKCGRCGAEVDAGFDVCWSCGATREAAATMPAISAAESESTAASKPASPFAPPPDVAPALPPPDDDESDEDVGVAAAPANPYRSPRHADRPRAPVADEEPQDRDTEEGDAAAQRAMRAAILGIFCFPLLHGYSGYLLLKIGLLDLPLGPRGKRHFAAALAIDLLAAAFVGTVLASMNAIAPFLPFGW